MKTYLFLALLTISQVALGQKTIIHCGRLIDGTTEQPQTEKSIIIEGKAITSVENGYTKPGNADVVIDLSNSTVMPGFIDMHVHIEGESSPRAYMSRFTDNPADVAFKSTVYARKNLMAGFTTLRDLGGSGVNIALRNAINRGTVIGPRIFTSGKGIKITGGHGDPTNGYRWDLMGNPGPDEGVVNGPWEARKAVRQRMKEGSDVIKITSTGGVLSVARDGSGPSFTEEEIKAIVETANDLGMHVASHAHGIEGMQRAIRAGVKTIEHGTYMDDETMELMKEYGTYYIPTIIAGVSAAENGAKPGYYPEVVAKKAREIGPLIQATFTKAYKAGVNIGFGTDAAVFPHGENAREFELMVEAGMKPMEAIKAATSVNSKILGKGDVFGSIQSGLLADIVAVDGDPLSDISILKNISFVMKEGAVYKLNGEATVR
ncbi:MAG: amidohydrolase family protein [Cyclobacteriaceae bacterium]